MKKTYEKPQVAIENFTLTENVAACGEVNLVSGLACTHTNHILDAAWSGLAEESVFVFCTKPDCNASDTLLENGDGWKICYHTSVDSTYNVFNS